MIYGKFLLAVFLLFYFDCNSVENGNSGQNNSLQNQTENKEIPDDLLITLERTICYGTCPAYKLTVKSDGTVLFEGLNYTNVKGKIEDKISAEKVKQLIKEFQTVDYFNLNGKYDTQSCFQVTDNPSASTSIRINGKTKSISHYRGCVEGTDDFKKELSNLTELEKKIDEIVETKRWIGERK